VHDFSSVGDDRVNTGRNAVNHDVKEKARICGGWAPEYPGAAHFASRIVKGDGAITAFPNVPVKDALVKIGRARDIGGGHFDIANLSVRKGGWHTFFPRYGGSF